MKVAGLLTTTILLFIAGQAQAEIRLATGFDYSSGKYGGSETTDTLQVPVLLVYETAPWMFTMYVPYLDAEGIVNAETGSATDSVSSQSGLGDIVLGMFHEWLPGEGDVGFDVGFKAKLVTADRDSDLLTSGNPDYTVQTHIYSRTLSPAFLLRLGWTVKGDIRVLDSAGNASTYDPDNPLDLGLALSFPVAKHTDFSIAYDWRERLFSYFDDASELSLLLSHRISYRTRLRGYVVRGLSDASPDWAVGTFVTFAW